MDPILSVSGLWKKYRLGSIGTGTFRHDFNRWWHLALGLADPYATVGTFTCYRNGKAGQEISRAIFPGTSFPKEVWALRDISFSVAQGEILGIIGHNGAGKSTLLKILSRITAPTRGEVRLKGRIASLLEVGTGFHPELTGRENIFLNGAILGMTRAEIRRKLDEIVAFAGVDPFLDTPVKRYSSGMHLRLAFAVAAHLEPEILIIDEILAVGDAEFQQKCLGKMDRVARSEGRTVLFVSHHMQAVRALCSRTLWIESGQIREEGAAHAITSRYLENTCSGSGAMRWEPSSAPGNGDFRLLALRAFADSSRNETILSSSVDLIIEFEFLAARSHAGLCIGFDLSNSAGVPLLRSYQTDQCPEDWPPMQNGRNVWRCVIPSALLNAGTYFISPRVGIHNVCWLVHLENVLTFEIRLDHGSSPYWNTLDATTRRPGMIAPVLEWNAVPVTAPGGLT